MKNSKKKSKILNSKLLYEYSIIRSNLKFSENYGLAFFGELYKYIKTKRSFNPIWDTLLLPFLNSQIDANQTIEIVDDYLYHLISIDIKNSIKIDWNLFLTYLGKSEIFSLIKKFHPVMPDEDYWTSLRHCYTLTEMHENEYEYLITYFLNERPKREWMMTKNERELFKDLPEEVSIYRGCSVTEINGGNFRFSWTLDRKMAEFFAFEYNKNLEIESNIVERTVSKKSLIAYFPENGEEEVIYIQEFDIEYQTSQQSEEFVQMYK
jgi:hypothetical protein